MRYRLVAAMAFSEAFGQRCSQLLCLDGHPKAVELARHRVAAHPHILVEHTWVHEQLPSQRFDLIDVWSKSLSLAQQEALI